MQYTDVDHWYASKKTYYTVWHPLLSNKRQLRTTQEVTTGKHVIKERVTEMTGPIITITSRSCYNCAGRNQCFPSTPGIILVTSYQECRSSCGATVLPWSTCLGRLTAETHHHRQLLGTSAPLIPPFVWCSYLSLSHILSFLSVQLPNELRTN